MYRLYKKLHKYKTWWQNKTTQDWKQNRSLKVICCLNLLVSSPNTLKNLLTFFPKKKNTSKIDKMSTVLLRRETTLKKKCFGIFHNFLQKILFFLEKMYLLWRSCNFWLADWTLLILTKWVVNEWIYYIYQKEKFSHESADHPV